MNATTVAVAGGTFAALLAPTGLLTCPADLHSKTMQALNPFLTPNRKQVKNEANVNMPKPEVAT